MDFKRASFYGIPCEIDLGSGEIKAKGFFLNFILELAIKTHAGLTQVVGFICSILGIDYEGFFPIKVYRE